MSKNEILLFIITDCGNIAIPFRNLQEADNYTTGFEQISELIQKIGDIVGRDLSSLRIIDSYLEYNYRISNSKNELKGRMPIKYKKDNYDKDDLIIKFTNYLKEDYIRILDFDIKYINFSPIHDYVYNNGSLTDKDIDMAVNAYFKSGNYKKIRDVYFKLKTRGLNIKTKAIFESKKTGNGNINDFDIKDEYLSSLADYARRGEEEYQNVMEIISLYDLEELGKKMEHPYYGMVDGMADYDQVFADDIRSLEIATGVSIKDIENIINGSIKEAKKR